MKFKPKEVLVNLPTVLTSFQSEEEIVQMAAAFNTFVHGKVKMKYEVLGTLGGQYVGLFYIQRNSESQQLHDEFMEMINQEEIQAHELERKLNEDPVHQLTGPDFDQSDWDL
jgi:hypothetical protein